MASDGRVVIDIVLEDGSIGRGIANIEQQIGGIGRASEGSSFGIMKMATAMGLVGAASKVFDMVKGSIDGAIKRVDTLSGFPVVMERMGFSSEVAEQSIEKLKDGIQGLPTTLDGIVGSTQNIALMTNDLESATETSLALNNAFLASGSGAADAERGLVQYVQMLSKGKVDMQSWNTLQETMGFALNKTAEAFGFTGKSAKNDLYSALQKGTITFDEFNNKLIELNDGVGGFAEIAQASGAGIGTSWANMKTAITSGTANIIQAIQGILADTPLESIEGILGRLKDAFSTVLNYIADNLPAAAAYVMDLYNKFEPYLPLMADIALAIGVTVAAFATFNTVVSVINKVKTAITVMNAAVMANPWAVAAAVAIFAAVMIYRNWDTIKEFFVKLWGIITDGASAAWDKVKEWSSAAAEGIRAAWEATKEFFSGLWDGITDTASSAWDATKEGASNAANAVKDAWNGTKEFFGNMWDGMKEGASNAWNGTKDTVTNGVSAIGDALSTAKGFVSDKASSMWDGMTEAATSAWDGLVSGVSGLYDSVMSALQPLFDIFAPMFEGWHDVISNSFEGITETFSSAWETIQTVTTAAWELIKLAVLTPILLLAQLIQGDFEGIGESISQVWDKVNEYTTEIWDAITEFISGAITTMIETVSENFNTMLTAISDTMSNIKQGVIDGWEAIKTGVTEKVESLKTSTVEGWENMKTAVVEKMEAIKTGVIEGWENLKTNSVNKVKETVENVKQSWEDMKTNVVNKTVQMKTDAVNRFEELKSQAKQKVSDMINNVKNFISDMATQVPAKVGQMKTNALSRFTELKNQAVQTMKQKVADIVTAISQMPGKVLTWIKNTKDNIVNPLKEINLLEIGKNIISGLIDGITSKIKDVKNAISNVASTVTDGIKGALDIHSPSRVMKQIGIWTIEGMEQGIYEKTDAVVTAVGELGEHVLKRQGASNKAWAEMTTMFLDEMQQLEVEHHKKLAEEKALARQAQAEKTKMHLNEATKAQEAAFKKEMEILQAQDREKRAQAEANRKNANKKEQKQAEEQYMTLAEMQEKAHAAGFAAYKDYISNRKDLNELSMVDEVKLWEQQLKGLEYGTKEYIETYKNYQSALKTVQNTIEGENAKFVKSMEDINKKLASDIDKAWDDYNKTYSKRVDELLSVGDLFSEFVSEQKYSSDALLDNMQSQVDGLKAFDEVMKVLNGRISDEMLLEQLGNLTPKSLGDLQALAEMTDEQLDQYVALYQEKFDLATSAASEELGYLKDATEENVQAMKDAANAELEALKIEWLSAMQVLTMTTDKELQGLEQIGRDAGQGLYDGLASMEGAIIGKATSIANAIKDAFTDALDIHSPSRFMRDYIVGNMAAGFTQGANKYLGEFVKGSEMMAGGITDGMLLTDLYQPIQNNRNVIPASTGNVVVNNKYEFNNTFTPTESTPSEHARKQRELARDLVYS